MYSKRKEIFNEDIIETIMGFEYRLENIRVKLSDDRVIDNGLFLMSYAIFEDSIRYILKVILMSFPEKLNMKSCKISRQQVCDIADNGYEIIIDNELYQLFKDGTKKQLEYLVSLISGKKINKFENDLIVKIEKCTEISLYRNAIIHNGAKITDDILFKCKHYKVMHRGDLVLSKSMINNFFDDYLYLFNYLKNISEKKYKYYSQISKVEKLRRLWYRCFDSPIMKFEDYWEIDEEHDVILNYKEPSREKSISSGESIYLSFWKNQFDNSRYQISNFMLCSINHKVITDMLDVFVEVKFFYMSQYE